MLSKDVLEREIEPVRQSDSGLYALGIMDEYKVEHLPVVEDEVLVGLVSELDLLDMHHPEASLSDQKFNSRRFLCMKMSIALRPLRSWAKCR